MRDARHRWTSSLAGRAAALAAILAVALAAGPLPAQEEAGDGQLVLGSVDFPTSARGEAQREFEVGLLALHSFWYPEARDHFRRARELDPSFAMAYWGEAMTHDHLLWGPPGEEGLAAGREVLRALDERKAKGSLAASERELAYVDAARRLFEGEEHQSRRRAFSRAMDDLAERYPNDDEAAIFAALARMGVPDFELEDAGDVVSVAAPLEEIYQRRPEHPGVLHYLIHVYDSPAFARMGLRQARRYADIAPASSHALHMPSHIFRELGMWEEMAASNEEAYRASVDWQQRTDRPLRARDFHAFEWLHIAYVNLGRYEDGRELIDRLEGLEAEAEEAGQSARPISGVRIRLEERQLQAERWAGLDTEPAPVRDEDLRIPGDRLPDLLVLGALGYQAAVAGQAEMVERIQARMQEFEGNPGLAAFPGWLPAALHWLEAHRLRAAGQGQRALAEAEEAVRILEEKGAGTMLTQGFRRLCATLLLEQGQVERAHERYAQLVETWPRRPELEVGLARSAARLGETGEAVERYRRLLDVWDEADAGLPALEEARSYVASHAPAEESQPTGGSPGSR